MTKRFFTSKIVPYPSCAHPFSSIARIQKNRSHEFVEPIQDKI